MLVSFLWLQTCRTLCMYAMFPETLPCQGHLSFFIGLRMFLLHTIDCPSREIITEVPESFIIRQEYPHKSSSRKHKKTNASFDRCSYARGVEITLRDEKAYLYSHFMSFPSAVATPTARHGLHPLRLFHFCFSSKSAVDKKGIIKSGGCVFGVCRECLPPPALRMIYFYFYSISTFQECVENSSFTVHHLLFFNTLSADFFVDQVIINCLTSRLYLFFFRLFKSTVFFLTVR